MTDLKITKSKPVTGITDVDGRKLSDFLNHLLADEYILFTKTLNYHWNITGPRFHSIHTFLEDRYKDSIKIMDTIAERVRILDERPISTMSSIVKTSKIHEVNGSAYSSNEMLADLFETQLEIQSSIKEFLSSNTILMEKDPVSEDLLIGLTKKHEEVSWMLKSYLQ